MDNMEGTPSDRLARWPFALDADKAVESVLYLLPRITENTLHCVAKVLYLADKLHLSRYGRPITGDWYAAMEFGPVPSATYDILKVRRGDKKMCIPERATAINVTNKKFVSGNRAADTDVLSQSEIECLKEAAASQGQKSFGERTDESHGPAWDATELNALMKLEHILLEVENADELREYIASEGA